MRDSTFTYLKKYSKTIISLYMKKTLFFLTVVTCFSYSLFAVNCKRNISLISAKEMQVEIIVSRQQASGIARLSEFIPEGAVIKYAKSEGGSVNTANNKMNFVWMALPTTDVFKVVYIISTEKLSVGDYSIAGKFSYVENLEKREVAIEASRFSISSSNEIKLSNSVTNGNNIAINPASSKTSKIVYGIQVMSTAKQLPSNYFSDNFNINEKVKIDNSKEQYKYIIGEFNDLNTALGFRESLVGKGLKDSFLVAFSDNKIISLAEAKERENTAK